MDIIRTRNILLLPHRLVVMRWWLLGGLAVAVLLAPTFLNIALPVPLLSAAWVLLAGFNILTGWRSAGRHFSAGELAGQLCVDLVGLGALLYLSGGAANPLVSLLLLPLAVAALTLPGRLAAAIALLAIAIYSFLMLFYLPLPIADPARAARLHLGGMWLTFVVSAVLMTWFVTRMMDSLRERDARLAEARAEAMRDSQVVALGQFAAGAAHELGTPLATINVLAGELLHEPQLPEAAREDIELLRKQVIVCKEIIGGLTARAGIVRAGTSQRVSATAWLEGLLARWRVLWPNADCMLNLDGLGEPPCIIPVPAVEQAVINLLNNAARVAPQGLALWMTWSKEQLMISVQDKGPGFPAEILRDGGSAPLPESEDGQGIGLWLTRIAVERAGGHLVLQNHAGGGVATISLPLNTSNGQGEPT